MAKRKIVDYANINTRSYSRVPGFSEEESAAARRQAAGRPQSSTNPALQAWAKNEVESRARRAVVGRFENKGRAPMHVLTPAQFSQFTETGAWEGMPTPEEYGPQSAGPEDKEYETNW